MKKILIGLLLLLVVAALVFWWRYTPPVMVRTATVAIDTVETYVANTRSGTVKACRRSRLSMPIGGIVDQLHVEEGDHVEAGQVLLSLWNKDRQAQVARAQAIMTARRLEKQQTCLNADKAEREHQRLVKLAEKELAAEEDVDRAATLARTSRIACESAESQIGVARAELDSQQSLLELTVLTAPFAGVVAEVNGEIGEYVTPSPPGIVTPPAVDLIDDNCLYVTAPIDEIDAARLRIGQPARIMLDAYPDRDFTGTLTRIAPYVLELEKQARTVDVDIRFDAAPEDLDLLVGYSADAEIILDRKSGVLAVPTEAIQRGKRVLVFNPGTETLEERTVSTGDSNWHVTEITDGLTAGEQVVVSLGEPGVVAGAHARPADD